MFIKEGMVELLQKAQKIRKTKENQQFNNLGLTKQNKWVQLQKDLF